jgi:hypothetical protein
VIVLVIVYAPGVLAAHTLLWSTGKTNEVELNVPVLSPAFSKVSVGLFLLGTIRRSSIKKKIRQAIL